MVRAWGLLVLGSEPGARAWGPSLGSEPGAWGESLGFLPAGSWDIYLGNPVTEKLRKNFTEEFTHIHV